MPNSPALNMPHHTTPPLIDALSSALETERFGHPARGYYVTDSTNVRAQEWARNGAAEGSLVLAEKQTRGRGRRGRPWQAQQGKNLTFSIILRPKMPAGRLGLITLASALAVAEAVASFVQPLEPVLKWPNDVLLAGQKCCGILLETVFERGTASTVVLGIGLNVNQDTFPPELKERATSLLLETGRHVPRVPLLARLLKRLERRYNSLSQDGGKAVRSSFEDRLRLGQALTLRFAETGTTVTGHLHGIDTDGALLLNTAEGLRSFYAGDVTLSSS